MNINIKEDLSAELNHIKIQEKTSYNSAKFHKTDSLILENNTEILSDNKINLQNKENEQIEEIIITSKLKYELNSAKSFDCNVKLLRKESDDVYESTDSTSQSINLLKRSVGEPGENSSLLKNWKRPQNKNKSNLQVQTTFNKNLYSQKYSSISRENSERDQQSNSSKSIIDDFTFMEQDQIIEDNNNLNNLQSQKSIEEIKNQMEININNENQENQQNEKNSDMCSNNCYSICSIKQQLFENQQKFSQFNKQYEIVESIGEGIQANVTKVRHRTTNKIYAAKTFRILDEEIQSQIQNEYELIQHLNHKGILQVYELLDQESQPTIIMEFFDGQNILNQRVDDLTIKEKVYIMLQLFEIIAYIHQEKIIHRDIQLRNILYNFETEEIKLIDFGISKKCIENQLSFSQCGYRHYQAPEMINCEQYSNKVDIWQLGQVFYEILENTQIHSKKLILSIQKQNLFFENTPKLLQDLILNLLKIDSESRIDIKQAITNLKYIIATAL